MATVTPKKTWHNGDPYDRLIVSAAIANQSILATKDRPLRRSFPDLTLWD